MIDQAAQNDLAESDDLGYEDCKEIYYDIVFYPDFLFIDTDFLFINKLYNTRKAGETFIEDIIEIKRGSSSYLRKGYEKQLTDYMLSTNYKNAFYLIACFTDSEYERSERFKRNHVYTDTIQLYINISILDFRKRKTASIS